MQITAVTVEVVVPAAVVVAVVAVRPVAENVAQAAARDEPVDPEAGAQNLSMFVERDSTRLAPYFSTFAPCLQTRSELTEHRFLTLLSHTFDLRVRILLVQRPVVKAAVKSTKKNR